MRIFLPFIFLFFVIISTSTYVQACSCTPGARLVKHEVKRSSKVIVGTVISIQQQTIQTKATPQQTALILDIQKVKIKVQKYFKGKKRTKFITIYTGAGKGDCGFNFRLTQRYIVYINENASPFVRQKIPMQRFAKTLWTDQCTRTQLSNLEELMALRSTEEE